MRPIQLACALAALLSAFPSFAKAEDWPGWRGPRGDGTSLETNVPTHWDPTNNILWKTELPGEGHSSPIVSGHKVFVVSALTDTKERVLLCLDAETGRVSWQKTVLVAPLERKHQLNSFASSTPATDGKSVYVTFLEGDQMLAAAYDTSGNEQWRMHPGPFSSVHGFCSSPVIFEDKVIINGDHDGDSYIVALSRKDGSTLWKTMRQNRTRSYCTPLVHSMSGRVQLTLAGDKCVASYDPKSGKLNWIIDGPTDQFVASPVFNEKAGLLFITGGYPQKHILAIKPDGSGNVTQTHIKWRTTKGVSYVPSPISLGDYYILISDQGEASCFEAESGVLKWQEKLGKQHASLVSANGLVYFVNDDGETHVIKAGPEYKLIAKNQIREGCFASPAISNGKLLIRGNKHLFCIGAK